MEIQNSTNTRKGLNYLSIFIIINLINDFWSIYVSSITLNHIFIVILLFSLSYKKTTRSLPVNKVRSVLIFYLVYILINSIITLGKFENQFIFISILLKSISFLILVPYFKSISKNQFLFFVKRLFFFLLFLVFLPGLYEQITRTNLMTFSDGLSKDVFYIRAFTMDKIDFGSNIILLIGCSLVLFREDVKFKYWYLTIILGSMILLVFSFSSTNILGLFFSGILYLIFYSKRKIISLFVLVAIGFTTYYFTKEYFGNYQNKFEIKEQQLGETEFRSVALKESISIWLESPLFGHGSEANGYLLMKNISWLTKPLNSHNFINEFTNYGLLGGVPLLYLFLYLFISVVRVNDKKTLPFLFWVILTGPLISRVFFYYHRFDEVVYVLWFCLSCLILLNNHKPIKQELR